ncbi:hypothetical protein [Heyndrickxia coagulans]|uniref:hypothetical protein n=1 Tax=Heyndrickxia coagulans TaxID=1398 RepID=UPI0011D2268E|nr:hypothetical protein [Heyndrickxia coagulans]
MDKIQGYDYCYCRICFNVFYNVLYIEVLKAGKGFSYPGNPFSYFLFLVDVCINERYFLCREPGSGIERIIAMNDHLVGPYIQRLHADHLQTKKRQRVFAAFFWMPGRGAEIGLAA